MRKKSFTVGGKIAAVFAALLSVCLVFGLWLFTSHSVYADDAALPRVDEAEEPTEPAPEKAENYWEITPNLVSWKWGEFDPAINRISGKAAYGNETLKFMLWHLTDGKGNKIDKEILFDDYEGLPVGGSNTEKNKGLFALDEDGNMPEQVIAKLETLDYGVYSLIPFVSETDEATGLGNGVDPSNGYTFNVLKGENRWTVSPYIIPWNWNEYRQSYNLISAVPAYFGEGEKVEFTVYAGASFADSRLASFYTVNGLMANGAAEQTAAEALASLDAGNYYLRAYIAGTENYDALDTRVQFTVRQVQNHWTTAPSIVQWTWGEYDAEVNVISAVPAYPAKNAVVAYGLYKDRACRIPLDDTGLLENFTAVTEERAEIISKLDAGTYYLEAETRDESANYSDLSSVIPFTIHTTRNNWTTTPNIVQWRYGEYEPEVNVISAVPRYSDGSVTFGIYKDAAHKNAVEGLENFTEVNADIAAKLGSLPANTYYLYARAEQAGNAGSTPNFALLETQTAVRFSVLKSRNYWTETPSVFGWAYGGYNKNVNLISAVPALGGAADISVFDSDGMPVGFVNGENTVTSFNLVEEENSLTVPAYVEKRLGGLAAGTYYMLATVKGGDNYTGLNEYTSAEDIKEHGIRFEITKVANSWAEIPKVLSWNEGRFSDSNKITANAAYGNDTMTVIVYDSDGKVVTSNQNKTQLDYDKISKLGVGIYRVTFAVAETGNYSALNGEIQFSVMEDSVSLSGIIGVTIAFAALDAIAAGVCITLMIIRRRKIEQRFRQMVHKELHGGNK